MPKDNKFTHLAVERTTQRKVALLATILDQKIYGLVAYWVDQEWKSAKAAGLVKESMLKESEKETA